MQTKQLYVMEAELMKFYVTGDDLFIFSEAVRIGLYVLL
jgi:hypothetical protein